MLLSNIVFFVFSVKKNLLKLVTYVLVSYKVRAQNNNFWFVSQKKFFNSGIWYKNHKLFGILWKRIWKDYFIKLRLLSQTDKSEKNRHRLWKVRAVLHAKLNNFLFHPQLLIFEMTLWEKKSEFIWFI